VKAIKKLSLIAVLVVALGFSAVLAVISAQNSTLTPTPEITEPTLTPTPTPSPNETSISKPEFTVKLINSTIEVTIKNQPFVPYYDTTVNWTINRMYNIRIKEHKSETWLYPFRASDGYPIQSADAYTVISFRGGTFSERGLEFVTQAIMTTFAFGAQVDFQFQTMTGYITRDLRYTFCPYEFFGETSDWSETQTITIPLNTIP
jgi:hypothetical protein